MSRIEWSPDGTRLLAHAFHGPIRVRTLDGALIDSADQPVLDARWAGDDIVTFDARSRLVKPGLTVTYGYYPGWASLAAAGKRVLMGNVEAIVHDIAIERHEPAWKYDPVAELHLYDRHLHHDALRRTFGGVLSDDGVRVALGYDSTTWDSDEAGFRWRVFDVDDNKEVASDYVPGATALAFAFDAAGKRLAYAGPPPHGPIGVVDLASGPLLAYPEILTGAGAVALDPHGAIAAFAVGRSIRFDDLESGGSLALPVDLLDVVALGFAPDSRAIACLASDGRVAVVPVP